ALYKPEDFSERRRSDQLQAAYNAIFFNRTTFSGMFGSGPIGGYEPKLGNKYPIDCRWNSSTLIEDLQSARTLLKDKTKVYDYRFQTFLKIVNADTDVKKAFVYLDPPYLKQGNQLYGIGMTEQEHKD